VWTRILPGAFVIAWGLAAPAIAQDDPPADAENSEERQEPAQEERSRSSAMDRLMRAFDRRMPEVGSHVPELTAYTADGQPVPLDQLEGEYRVLVFGCLT